MIWFRQRDGWDRDGMDYFYQTITQRTTQYIGVSLLSSHPAIPPLGIFLKPHAHITTVGSSSSGGDPRLFASLVCDDSHADAYRCVGPINLYLLSRCRLLVPKIYRSRQMTPIAPPSPPLRLSCVCVLAPRGTLQLTLRAAAVLAVRGGGNRDCRQWTMALLALEVAWNVVHTCDCFQNKCCHVYCTVQYTTYLGKL